MFIVITPYRTPDPGDIRHFTAVSPFIDHLMIRTPMPQRETADFLTSLLEAGFPKNKLLIHSDMALLERFDLNGIHFRENDADAFRYKQKHPEITVSMSTHSARTVEAAEVNGLDFVLFGHIFETASKPARPPRTEREINQALSSDIPVIALGGINERTIHQLPGGFDGIAAISYFMDAAPSEIKALRKGWELSNLM
ncbi:thiamine phosphate synthase [Salinicoccus halitifaciens]|uniref:Thiazole tautomerase (Transcriptional regulator TenI) n=1 Tax=Salinicoccus halitifaciens TaxID=1073415 RepID=A0ABV2EAZ1_9STAP|nr:thiamine phosphate synthase [Salinicoccus halitifaciens]MCD2137577.1 thiamine phosphate synthase [Salinicoccus halitifaciens]